MDKQMKAILVVSFGTSHEDTRIKTIESIEHTIQEAFPESALYRAWTSKIIREILKKRDQIQIDSVEEAFERMYHDGIREVTVQPTHVINGIENDRMRSVIASWMDKFDQIFVGDPLLTTQEDNDEIVDILADTWKDIPSDEAIILMGHGTPHYANSIYAALDYTLKDRQIDNLFLATVEAYPSLETVKEKMKELGPKKVHLTPFMIVAGDHAKNDMAGDDEDSWKSQFEQMDIPVVCHLEGLGENAKIRDVFVRHVREAK